jgi:NAD(P)-dependent dehydrogenase (short-subunit alcohol dehydrogenase family)
MRCEEINRIIAVTASRRGRAGNFHVAHDGTPFTVIDVDEPGTETGMRDLTDAKTRARGVQTPMVRPIKSDEAARLTFFLFSNKASFAIGTALPAAGGESA